MNNNLLEFDYEGRIIPFAFNGNDYMINATEMARSVCKSKEEYGNKRPARWLRSQEAVDYLDALLNVRNLVIEDVIQTTRGGSNYSTRTGTWMHRWVAIRYAQWLEPRFAVWVDMKIDEIISNGYAFRDAEIQRLQGENNNLNSMIQSMQPQADYYKSVLTYSKITYSTEEICKALCLGYGPRVLLSKLEKLGYIYRRPSNIWHLSSGYDNCGYLVSTTKLIKSKKTGKEYAKPVKRWTENGKHWIWSLKEMLGRV